MSYSHDDIERRTEGEVYGHYEILVGRAYRLRASEQSKGGTLENRTYKQSKLVYMSFLKRSRDLDLSRARGFHPPMAQTVPM